MTSLRPGHLIFLALLSATPAQAQNQPFILLKGHNEFARFFGFPDNQDACESVASLYAGKSELRGPSSSQWNCVASLTPASNTTMTDRLAQVDIPSKNRNPPRYPKTAVSSNHEGTSILQIDVDAEGNIASIAVAISSGYPEIDDAAMAAAKTWSYLPAIINGKAAVGSVRIPVRFSL